MHLSEKESNKDMVNIFWFRRDLRLFDNHGLFEALQSGKPVLPVFVFDKDILKTLEDPADKRVNFIYKVLKELNEELKKYDSSLIILHDTPLAAFKELAEKFNVSEVFTNHDYEPYAINRDEKVKTYLSKNGINFRSFKDQVIWEKEEITKPDGSPYKVFTPYSKQWKHNYKRAKVQNFPSENFLTAMYSTDFPFPELSKMGFQEEILEVPALNTSEEIISHYAETRNLPAIEGTSYAGIYLRFGTVSVRQLVKMASEVNEIWLNELIWREFFMMILYHFPEVEHSNFKKKYDKIQWRNNEQEFKLWCKGETGYPMVDAGMRQLNKTGWMHNRVRMVVAGFLTKHLLIDWRWGEAYFAQKLLDYELASNNGNWQWAAGTGCDAAPYFRIFNPSEQLKKFDPELKYVKKWIPNFTADYLPPIVEHKFARQRALEAYKSALQEL